jgi:hypothetical protein
MIQILKTRFSRLSFDGVREVRDALFDAESRLRAAHIGSNQAGSHEQQRSRIIGIAGGEASHERVERGVASTIDLVAPDLA